MLFSILSSVTRWGYQNSSGKKLIGPTQYPLSNTRDETQRDATLANPSNFRTSKTHVLVLGNAQPPGPVMTKHSVLVWCKLSLRKSHHTHTLLQYVVLNGGVVFY